MTDHTDLLEQSFELNLNNYGPEDVERLNDWAIKAYAALETLQAAVAQWRVDFKEMVIERDALQDKIEELTSEEHSIPELRQQLNESYEEKRKCYFAVSQYEKANANLRKERDAALARLAELEKQEPVGYASKEDIAELQGANGMSVWCESSKMWGGSGDPPLPSNLTPIYAAAGASPVEPSQAQPPAPSEAAREYMTGYSDGREWAGATNQAQQAQSVPEPVLQWCDKCGEGTVQGLCRGKLDDCKFKQAQPERAEDSVNAKRYLWLRDEAYSAGGKTPFIVIGRDDSNCYVVSGTTADEAIDAAIKQGGQQ